MGQKEHFEENLSDLPPPPVSESFQVDHVVANNSVTNAAKPESNFPELKFRQEADRNGLNSLRLLSDFPGVLNGQRADRKVEGQEKLEGQLLVAINESTPFTIVDSNETVRKAQPDVDSKQEVSKESSLEELTVEQKEQLEFISKDPTLVSSAKKLMGMLDSKADPEARIAASSLLSMLASSDKQEKNDGLRLLKMLGEPAKENVARNLLSSITFDSGSVHKTLEVLNNPSLRDAANLVTGMLSGTSERDRAAALGLVRMLSDVNPSVKKDAQELVKMLGDKDQSLTAKSILRTVDDNGQIGQLLTVLRNPEMKQAEQELLKSLDSDKSGNASELLRLLNSKSPEEKLDGQKLLKLLNSTEQRDRNNATSILQQVNDADQRRYLIGKLESPQGRSGAEKVLEMLSSSAKREREGVRELLSEAARDGGSRRAEKLISMLSGDQQEQGIARTILTRVNHPGQRTELLNMLSSKENSAAAKEIVSWLNGTNDQRAAAHNMLQFVYSKTDQSSPGRPVTAEERKQSEQTIGSLLKKIADPAEQTEAATVLKALPNISQVSKLFELMNNPQHKDASQELVKMLGSKDYSQQRGATAVLEMLGARASVDVDSQKIAATYVDARKLRNDTANNLLKMLGKPEERDAAKQMLTSLYRPLDLQTQRSFLVAEVPGVIEVKRAQDLYAQDKKAGEQMLSILNSRDSSMLAREMLSSLSTPAELKKVLDILSNPDSEKDAQQLRELPHYIANGKTGNLLKMLASDNAESRSTGKELLQKLQSPFERFDAQNLLTADLSTGNLSALNRLLSNETTKPAGDALKELLVTGESGAAAVRAVLRMSVSDDKASRQSCDQLVKMLCNPKDQGMAKDLLSSYENIRNSGTGCFERMIKAVGSDNERQGAQELLKVLNSSEEGVNSRALQMIFNLTSGDPRSKQSAEKLLSMLGSSDSQKLAKNMISSLPAEQWSEFLTYTSPAANQTIAQKEAGKQLKQLLESSNPLERNGVGNLLALLKPVDKEFQIPGDASRLAAGKHLLGMLGNRAEQANVRNIVSKIERSGELEQMSNLLRDPAQAGAGRVLTEMLRSTNRQDNDAATSFLRASFRTQRIEVFQGGENASSLKNGVNTLVSMLGRPETRDLARLALASVSEADHVGVVGQMLADKRFHSDIKKLNEMVRGKSDATAATTILDQVSNAGQVSQMLAMKQQKPESFNRMVSLLNGENGGAGVIAARRALNLLSSAGQSERSAGNEYLKMLSSDRERDVAVNLLNNLSRGDERFLQLLKQPDSRNATETLMRLMEQGDSTPANKLMSLLQSDKKEQKLQGESLLSMLRDPKYQNTAIRMLRQVSE